jgi:hypothetical protein
MEADQDLALHLLARAGALLEDASAIAIAGKGVTIGRIASVSDSLDDARRLLDAARVVARSSFGEG